MQIFTPRIGETIHIGDGIELTVVAIEGSQIRFNRNTVQHVRVDSKQGCRGVQANRSGNRPTVAERTEPTH